MEIKFYVRKRFILLQFLSDALKRIDLKAIIHTIYQTTTSEYTTPYKNYQVRSHCNNALIISSDI